ncbi:MAG: ATP-binding protein [Candidatus Alcyoniella australis]|nr:ATP-binding protein [Candidatus Alcyoniella australis]
MSRQRGLGLRWGLRTEIVLNITLLILALIGLISMAVMTLNKRSLVQQQVNSGRYVIGGFQAALSTLVDPQDPGQALREIFPRLLASFENPAQSPPIYGALIVDSDFDVIAHSHRALIGTPAMDDQFLAAAIRGRPVHEVTASGGSLGLGRSMEIRFSAPLFLNSTQQPRDEPIAYLRFTLRDEQAMGRFRLLTRGILAYEALAALILVPMISLLLMRTVVRPVRQLLLATTRISEGDYSVRIPRQPANEIGLLAQEFNRMAQRLQSGREELDARMEQLERAHNELSSARDELIVQDRLAYLGRVAAGVAHEIGNPLSAIVGYLEILKLGGDSDEPIERTLERAEREVARIDTIVRSLLDFARPGTAQSLPADPAAIARMSVELLKTQRALDNFEIELRLEEDMPAVVVDQGQLRQVLVNLIINATDAMPLGGRIEVGCSAAAFDPLAIKLPSMRPAQGDASVTDPSHGVVLSGPVRFKRGDPCVTIWVRDRGEGMEPELLQRIFEPFYTTKPAGRGTGLGLAICQRIVEAAGGLIAVESHRGEGSKFAIHLPVLGEQE